jgi:hypothetical protein
MRPISTLGRRAFALSTSLGVRCVESQRDSGIKPRVASQRATLGKPSGTAPTPTGLRRLIHGPGHNPFRVEPHFIMMTQGSSCLATLGWRTQSLWDCPKEEDLLSPALSSFLRQEERESGPAPQDGLVEFGIGDDQHRPATKLELVKRPELIAPAFEHAVELFQVLLKEIAQQRQAGGTGKFFERFHVVVVLVI